MSQTNNVCFMMFSVSVQDQQSTVLSLLLIKSIMFLVLAMLSSAAGRFGGTNIGGVPKNHGAGAISSYIRPSYRAYILCFGPMKKCLVFFFLGPAKKKKKHTPKKKKNGEVLRIG